MTYKIMMKQMFRITNLKEFQIKIEGFQIKLQRKNT